jgi:hypothetical protein
MHLSSANPQLQLSDPGAISIPFIRITGHNVCAGMRA